MIIVHYVEISINYVEISVKHIEIAIYNVITLPPKVNKFGVCTKRQIFPSVAYIHFMKML